MRNIIRPFATAFIVAALALGAGSAELVAPAQATPSTTHGPCLFGHVDPNDSNSACRFNGQPPETTARPDGSPALSCSRLNKGQNVRTHDGLGWRYWICSSRRDQWGNTYYEWDEILGM